MGWESWLSVDVLWHEKYREYWGSTMVRDSVKNRDFGGQGITLFIILLPALKLTVLSHC